ncbi:hypothetical protein LTR09_010244 [Extremus antarcticus]|uniref:Uncharacterized protein n=1 Tax=Extremus antarcticus TaxID=702011 RepID=A0AAJ0G8T7_9PEZI|nr:hypothetical protein LTR09_010244 [Extremus antarcticus]
MSEISPDDPDADFEDLKAVPALSQINPVGVYKDREYRSFNVLQVGVFGVGVSGVKPHSGMKVAANSITSTLLTGSPGIIPAASYISLTLESLYIGCVANTASSVTGVPQQCTVAFTAYQPGSDIAYETINEQFDPTDKVLSSMAKVTFPSRWKKMSKISIAIVQATTTSPLAALFFDDISYELYKS